MMYSCNTQVAKCSMCKRARKMTETVKWLNEMKHFCNLKCLMHFCGQQAGSLAALVTPVKPAVTQGKTSYIFNRLYSINNCLIT